MAWVEAASIANVNLALCEEAPGVTASRPRGRRFHFHRLVGCALLVLTLGVAFPVGGQGSTPGPSLAAAGTRQPMCVVFRGELVDQWSGIPLARGHVAEIVDAGAVAMIVVCSARWGWYVDGGRVQAYPGARLASFHAENAYKPPHLRYYVPSELEPPKEGERTHDLKWWTRTVQRAPKCWSGLANVMGANYLRLEEFGQ